MKKKYSGANKNICYPRGESESPVLPEATAETGMVCCIPETSPPGARWELAVGGKFPSCLGFVTAVHC